MQAGQFRLVRDILAFGGALAALAVLFLVMELDIIVSLVVAIVVFLGLFFIFNPKSMQQIADSRLMSTRARATGSMTGFRVKVSQLQNISGRIESAGMREHILDVAEMSKDIANAIERTPGAPDYVIARLDYTYTLLMKLLGRYIGLMHSTEPRDHRHAESLEADMEQAILEPLEQAIRRITADVEDGAKRVDVSPIDQAVQALEAKIKAEGLLT